MSEYEDEPPPAWQEDECLPLDELHPLIDNAARPLLNKGDEAAAIEAAWRALRDLLRERLGSHSDGRALVDAIGKADSDPRLPLTPNRTPSQRSQHDGIVHLLRGVVAYVRNPTAHESESPFARDWWTTLHMLVIMSLCTSHVEDAGTAEAVRHAMAIISQRDFPRTPDAVGAAVGRVARHQRARFIAEILVWARRFAQRKDPRLAGLIAGYDHVMALSGNPASVLETASAGASDLLLRTSTTEAGMRFLAPGVTERLDPAAYVKVCVMLTTAVTNGRIDADENGENWSPAASSDLDPERFGRLCASLREPDRANLVTRLLVALRGDTRQVAFAGRVLPAVVVGDAVGPTDLQRRAVEGIAQALVGGNAVELAKALQSTRDSTRLSFQRGLRDALQSTIDGSSDPDATAVARELLGELEPRTWQRRRTDH